MKKLTKKDKKFRKVAILSLIGAIILYFVIITFAFKQSKLHYEYIKDGKAYRSEYCFARNQITYCQEGNNIIEVNGYYTTD